MELCQKCDDNLAVVTLIIMTALLGVIASCAAKLRDSTQDQSSTSTDKIPIGNQTERSLADILVKGKWRAVSNSLPADSLEATFKVDNSFEGELKIKPSNWGFQPGRVNGKWHVKGRWLHIRYTYTSITGGYRSQDLAEQAIELIQESEYKLVGKDKMDRLWEWERIDRKQDQSSSSTDTIPLGNQNARSLAGILVRGRWRAVSGSIGADSMEVIFKGDNTFEGVLKSNPENRTFPPGPVKGTWRVVGRLLFLKYTYTINTSGYLSQHEAEQAMEITQLSEDKLVGFDKYPRTWEWDRID